MSCHTISGLEQCTFILSCSFVYQKSDMGLTGIAKVLVGLPSFLEALGWKGICFLPFPTSRGFPHSLPQHLTLFLHLPITLNL